VTTRPESPTERRFERDQPFVYTREGVRAVDRTAIEDFGTPGIVLMENAAAALTTTALRLLNEAPGGAIVCCGTGNNGGDGFALARRLANAGAPVACLLVGDRNKVAGDAFVNLRICERMAIPLRTVASPADDDAVRNALQDLVDDVAGVSLVVDALVGTGVASPLREPVRNVVREINRLGDAGARVLAVDVPTGLDCDTGEPLGGEPDAVVEADVTVTFCGLKVGFGRPGASAWLGRIVVGDIGAPFDALRRHAIVACDAGD